MFLGEKAVVNGLEFASFDFFDIAARANPFRAQLRQTACHIDICISIAPRTARIVNTHRLVHFDLAIHRFRRRERNLAERNTKIGMQFPGHVNFARIRKVVAAVADRGCCRSIWTGVSGARRTAISGYSRAVMLFAHTKSHAREIAWLRCPSGSDLPSAALPASGSRGSIGISRRSSQPRGSPALISRSD